MEDSISVMVPTKDIKDVMQQRRPFESKEAEVFFTLLRTTDLVAERASAPVRQCGLTSPQYNVLRILRGSRPEGLQTYQVAERMIARAPNITRLVDKLEAKGLLTRARSQSDRRVVTLQIAEPGLRLLEELEQPISDAMQEAMQGLRHPDQESLCAILNRLRDPLEG